MEIEITVKVNGKLVKQRVEQVDGTLYTMEERIDAMSRAVACDTLQAAVDAVVAPRPLFRKKAEGSATKDTKSEHGSD